MFDYQDKSFTFNHAIWNQNPKSFDLEQPSQILPYAVVNNHVKLSFKNTFAVMDVRTFNHTIKSIILDAQRGIIATNQSTHVLTASLVNTLIYENKRSTAMVAEQLGCSQTRLPIVQNQYILSPLGAATRSSTNWIGIHRLSNYQSEGKRVKLEFANQLSLMIPRSLRSFEVQVRKARRIQAELHKMTQQDLDEASVNEVVVPNQALNASTQGRVYREWSTFVLAQYGIDAHPEDINFYIRKFFGKL
ncbi:hypothetical protein [Lactiplantibacillus paraxiangfangensis]|uniref:hypothetical protein n=1 Tax=Lactiplantibacillus paraxiangfangensis TaxID=3076224 RepID=UPI0030C6B020